MGSLLTAAVPGLRCPEEANLRAPDAVVSLHVSFINAGAELIETNTFGANRRKLAQHFLEDDFERINSAGVKLAREAREITGRDVFIGGSIGPVGERGRRRELRASRRASSRGAAPTCSCSRRSSTSTSSSTRSRRSAPCRAADRRADDLRQDAETLAGVSARDGRRAAARARRGRVRREPRPRARPRRSTALAEMARRRSRARGAAERRPRDVHRRPGGLPARDARVLRRVRRPRASARRAADRRLLRDDARGDRGDPRRDRREPRRAAGAAARASSGDEALPQLGEEQPTELARLLAAGEFVVSVQLDPPLGGNAEGLLDAARRIKESGPRAVRRRQRQPARAGADERADGVGRRSSALAGIEVIPHLTPRDSTLPGSSRCCSARTPRACGTSSRSPATRPRWATTRAPAPSTRSTRSGSSS